MHSRVETTDAGVTGILRTIIARWKLVVATTFIGLVAATIYLANATFTYAVTYRVSPTQSDISNLTRRFGGLAAVTGISLGADRAVSPFDLYIEALYSPQTAEMIARRPDLMRGAFHREWNPRHSRFEQPASPFRPVFNTIKAVLNVPVYPWEPPGPARMQKFIEDEVILVRDPKRTITTLAIDHEDPEFAGALLEALHEVTDEMIRQRALLRAEAYIAYLSRTLQSVALLEHREALAETLGEQERIRMMSSTDVAYAAEPLGRPAVSIRPTKPKPFLVLVLGVLAGGFAGVLAALGIELARALRWPHSPVA